MFGQVPIQKIGTPFQQPNWRYEVLRNPDKFGFRNFCSRKKDNASYLKRLIGKGMAYKVEYVFPKTLDSLTKDFPDELKHQLYSVWSRHWKKSRRPRLRIEGVKEYTNLPSWHAAKIVDLQDEWLLKAIRHVFNLEFSPEIAFALRLHAFKEFATIKQFIGYEFFCGTSDVDLAKQWKFPVKNITALRKLFFDFSSYPQDKVSQWAVLAQWKNNEVIPEEEFGLYKRIYELGPLGLKAQVSTYSLTQEERQRVNEYLSKSALDSVLRINFMIRTARDAYVYNKVLQDVARLDLQYEEVKLKRKEQQLLEMQIKKMDRDLEQENTQVAVTEDVKLLQEAITLASNHDNKPLFRSIFDLAPVQQ